MASPESSKLSSRLSFLAAALFYLAGAVEMVAAIASHFRGGPAGLAILFIGLGVCWSCIGLIFLKRGK